MFFFFFSKPYISVIGEPILKTNQKESEYLKRLEEVLCEINQQYEAVISAKFMPTINNEFQGLICEGKQLLSILLEIKYKMQPYHIRFGIGIGEVEEESMNELSIRVKGPGYEKAREAIIYLRELEKRKQTILTDVRVEVAGEPNEKLYLVNTILSLLTTIESSWSDRQREIIYNMMKYGEKQSGVAKRLGITQSTVQKSLTAGKFYTFVDAVKTLNTVFAEIGEHRS